jgi:hypothetical protein
MPVTIAPPTAPIRAATSAPTSTSPTPSTGHTDAPRVLSRPVVGLASGDGRVFLYVRRCLGQRRLSTVMPPPGPHFDCFEDLGERHP